MGDYLVDGWTWEGNSRFFSDLFNPTEWRLTCCCFKVPNVNLVELNVDSKAKTNKFWGYYFADKKYRRGRGKTEVEESEEVEEAEKVEENKRKRLLCT